MNNAISVKKGSFISKEESRMLQAVAVMLMVFHHLFGFPERIHVPYVLVLDSFGNIETLLSYFGRICIAMFAFCSGYGLQKKALSSNAGPKALFYSTLSRLWSFLQRYWLVFLVFVPLGFALKVYSFQSSQFQRGFLGLSCVYNEEWWYTGFYLRFVLLFPFLYLFMGAAAKKAPWLLHGLMAFYAAVAMNLPDSVPGSGLLSVLIYFVEGMCFVTFDWFERLEALLGERKLLKAAVGICLCGAVFVLRTLFVPDHLLVPFMIFGTTLILKQPLVRRWLGGILGFIGKYNTYIWLTHTFFGYYYFQTFTFLPRFSPLIFLWCMTLSICVGVAGEWLLSALHSLFRRIHSPVKEK